MQPLRYVLWVIVKLFLSLRYRVRVHGLDKLRDHKGPMLILPNHPGYVDPPLVLSVLWPSPRVWPNSCATISASVVLDTPVDGLTPS